MRYPPSPPSKHTSPHADPHQTLHKTTITHIHQLTPTIRILHLSPTNNTPINVRPPHPLHPRTS